MTGAAVANAVYALTGMRLRRMPFSLARVKALPRLLSDESRLGPWLRRDVRASSGSWIGRCRPSFALTLLRHLLC